jgi:2Fe-2S ferredoxin
MSDHAPKPLPPVDLSQPPAENIVRVTFLPEDKTVEFPFDTLPYEGHGLPMSFLDVAENYDIFLDHACGGVCACTTCHLWVKQGATGLSEAEDKELDRMETAADIQLNSRLGPEPTWSRFPSGIVTTSRKASPSPARPHATTATSRNSRPFRRTRSLPALPGNQSVPAPSNPYSSFPWAIRTVARNPNSGPTRNPAPAPI